MDRTTKILTIRFSAMGDVAMAVPVLQAVLQQNTKVEILMVSRPFFKPIFNNLPRLTYIDVDLKNHKGINGLYYLFRDLKTLDPDNIADLHDVLRSKVLRYFFKFSGYQISVIDKGRSDKKKLTRTSNKVRKPLQTTHERYADVFRKLGLKVDLSKVVPLKKPQISSQVDLFLKTFQGQKLLGIAPFAAHMGKQYPLAKIKELIRQLFIKDSELNILLLGGGSDEKNKLDTIEKIDRNRIVNIAGMFSFEEELQIISRLNCMLSMDSGNGHLAAMFGVPVITIWGATHPDAGFAPFRQNEAQQILPDLEQFPQLPTSVYGNKTFDHFEQVWDSIAIDKINDAIITHMLP